jgi:hypothetical protein
MKTRRLQATFALIHEFPIHSAFGLSIYVAATRLAPFGRGR